MKKAIHTAFFLYVLILTISCKTNSYLKIKETFTVLNIDSTITKSPQIDSFLSIYKAGTDSIMDVVIGKTTVPLTKSQPECTMGNFAVDAQMEYSKKIDEEVQIAVINQGGLRINYLAPGDITVGNIYEIMPFDNTLSILEVNGEQIDSLCNHIIKYGGWPISGLSFTVSKDLKAINIKVNGKALHPHFVYKVATSDYLANGGDNCIFFTKCKRKNYNIFIRDMLLDYLKVYPTIHPTLENKITYEQ